MLQTVIVFDYDTVLKHKTTILECLNENERSIKQLALELTYLISNPESVVSIT